VTNPALQAYLAAIDPKAAPLVIALDGAIQTAHPGFDVAVKYKILMYTIGGDWRTWVCAIDATKKGVGLRFLFGVLLDDPKAVLRAGTSVLKTWDMGFDDVIDRDGVGAYISEAVSRHGAYKANATEILEASRSSAKPGRRPKAIG
jgi:hypothetical protein